MNARRKKLTGRIFLRGETYYGRYRSEGKETTFCTGIRTSDPVENGLTPLQRAEAMLIERTDVLRIKSRIVQMTALRGMMESAEEQLARRIEELKQTTLRRVPEIFEKSKMRIDCSDDRLERYKGYVERLESSLGPEFHVKDIDNSIADTYATELDDFFAASTFNKHMNGLSLVWKTLIRIGLADRNPWDCVNRKKLDTHTRRVLTVEETNLVIDTALGEMKTLIALGLYTGQRLGDLCMLRWESVKTDRIVIDATMKTGARTVIPIVSELRDYLPERTGEFVMPRLARSYTKDPSSVSDAAISLFRKCRITTSSKGDGKKRARPDCTFHSLRHTFTSRAVESGVPLTYLQAILGHTSQRMTDHYTHLSDDAILKAFLSCETKKN